MTGIVGMGVNETKVVLFDQDCDRTKKERTNVIGVRQWGHDTSFTGFW